MLSRVFSLLFLAFAFFPAQAAAQSPGEPELDSLLASPEQWGEMLINEQNWPELDALGAELSNDNPHGWRGWYFRGLAKEGLADAAAAALYFVRAEILLPKKGAEAGRRGELFYRAGAALERTEKWAAAEQKYRAALAEFAGARAGADNNAPLNLAPAADAAAAADAADAALWGKLRLVLARQEGAAKRRQEAEVIGKMLAFAAHAKNDKLWRRRGDLLDGLGDAAGARAAYGESLRLSPADLPVAEWVFAYDVAAGDAAAVKIAADALLKLDAKHPAVHAHFGDAAAAKGNTRRAFKHYETAAANGDYRRAQARGFAGLGDLYGGANNRRALDNYIEAIRADPSYLPGWEGAAVVLRILKQNKRAEVFFRRQLQVKRFIANGEEVPAKLLLDL